MAGIDNNNAGMVCTSPAAESETDHAGWPAHTTADR